MIYNLFNNIRIRGILVIIFLSSILWFYPFILNITDIEIAKPLTKLDVYLGLFAKNYTLLSSTLALATCLITSFLINRFLIVNQLSDKRTYFPAFISVLTFGSVQSLLYFNSSSIILLLIIAILHLILSTYRIHKALPTLFLIGVISGVIALLDFRLFTLLVTFIICLYTLRLFSFRELFATIFGFLAPIYILFSVLFIVSASHQEFLKNILDSLTGIESHFNFAFNTNYHILQLFILITASITFINFLIFNPVNRIKQTKFSAINLILFLWLIILGLAYKQPQFIAYITLPAVFIISIQLVNIKQKKYLSVFSYLLISTIIASRLYPLIEDFLY